MKQLFISLFACAALGACAPQVGGGSATAVSGSAGPQGSTGTAELIHCPAPVATIAIETDQSQNPQVFAIWGIPSNPLPAARLIAQQSGCYRIVNRDVVLRNIQGEREFERSGELKKGSGFGKGQLVGADYTILVEVIANNSNGGGLGVAAMGARFIPYVGLFASAIASGVRFQDAQVQMTLVDNHSGVQLAVATGTGSGTSFSLGGGFGGFGAFGGGAIGAGGYENTEQGKVVMAAMIDALNHLEPQVASMGTPRQATIH
jgi:curli biogenesis system outer membrane secretion channel CsgG